MNSDDRLKMTRFGLGLISCSLAFYFLLTHSREPVVFFASLYFLVICATDTLRNKIPNLATLSLLLVGLGHRLSVNGPAGGGLALAGLLTGLALLIIPYLMGGMGGGDVKALAALGALLGPAAIFQVFLLSGLIGGGIALVYLAVSDKPLERLLSWRGTLQQMIGSNRTAGENAAKAPQLIKFSYGPSIALGFFAFISWGGSPI